MEEDRTTISVGIVVSTIERWRERMSNGKKGVSIVVKVLKNRRSPDFTPT